MMRFGNVCRRFVSGTTVLGFGLVLGSAGMITGCGDSDKSAGQVENAVNPTKKAQDSMQHFQKTELKKSKEGVRR